MLNTLRKYFIPHSQNDHKPHMLQNSSIALLFGLVLVSEISFLSDTLVIIPRSSSTAAVIASTVTDATNQNRLADNIPLLSSNTLLIAAAQAKATDMATRGYFSHNTPDGKTPWYWLQQANYPYLYAGENLAVNFYDSQDVVNAWMNSPLHRANILDQHYTDIGIASAQGNYQGSPALFVVQFFGSTATTSTSTITNIITSAAPASVLSAIKNLAFANPRKIVDVIYFIVFVLIAFSLLLAVFVRIKIQHPKSIATAVLFLIVIVTLAVFNHELFSTFGSIG